MNPKQLRHLTLDTVIDGGNGTKTGGLSSGGSGDKQMMRDEEQDDKETKHTGRQNWHRAKKGTGRQRLAEAGRQDNLL